MRLELHPHPDTPASDHHMTIDVWVDRWPDGRLELSYHLHADTDRVVIPPAAKPLRTNELWKTTCFEFFVKTAEGYHEYNFSPSGAWAAYAFDGYRSGMRPLEFAHAPQIDTDDIGDTLLVDAVIDLEGEGRFGLSAVIEEQDGTKSYWALAHPPGKPDFHHDACFTATLPPFAPE
jgi:hypothetical protein